MKNLVRAVALETAYRRNVEGFSVTCLFNRRAFWEDYLAQKSPAALDHFLFPRRNS